MRGHRILPGVLAIAMLATACGDPSSGRTACQLVTKADLQHTISYMQAKEPTEGGGDGFSTCAFSDVRQSHSVYVHITIASKAGDSGFERDRKAAIKKPGSTVQPIKGLGDEAFSYLAPDGFGAGSVEARHGGEVIKIAIDADDPIRYARELAAIALRRQ
jgi:hypothetical protein